VSPESGSIALGETELGAVERLLSDARGKGVSVCRAEPIWGRSHVLRLTEKDGATSILKRYSDRGQGRNGRAFFAVELASLELLADMPRLIAPRLVGQDPDSLVIVMEDLPPGRSLADSLLLGTRAEVEVDLVAYASSLGATNCWTLSRAEEFNDARRRYAPDSELRSWWLVAAEGSRDQLGVLADELGVGSHAVDKDLTDALELLGNRYSCFVHADACPDNVRITDGVCRLFDFELSAAGCATLDFGYLVAPFPSCWCFAALPEEIATEAQSAYWKAFESSGVARDQEWEATVAAALGCYLVARIGRLEAFLASPQPWGTTTGPPRVLQWTAAASAAAEAADVLPSLRSVFGRLHEMVAASLPLSQVPQYPALAVPPDVVVEVPDWWHEGL
jgi:hypothetical protein